MILLKFEKEIQGDSSVDEHDKWITLDSVQFGVGRAISTSGVGKDRDTSNPSFSEISITKSMDAASGDLMLQAACGISLGKAQLHFVQTGGVDVKVQVYLEIDLRDAIISSYSQSSGGERPTESISINFNAFSMKYSPFDKGGTVTTGKPKAFDLMTNKPMGSF